MRVSLYDFSQPNHEDFKREIGERINRIIGTDTFIEGSYNLSFEKAFAQMQQARHCLLVGNGTDALEIALKASGVKTGDKVAVPSITFWATAEAVLNIGAEPVFVDVLRETGLVDPDSLEAVIDEYHPSAVMPVHIYGLPVEMSRIKALCDPRGIAIIEDAAQAHGALVDGKPVGHGPNPAAFSFYPTKNLGAFGDAGCILTRDDGFAHRIRTLRNHGRGDEKLLGRNSRCDHIQAAVLDLKLAHTKELYRGRRQAAAWYHERLRGLPLCFVPERYLETSSWHLYPVFFQEDRTAQDLQRFLAKHQVQSALFYPKALLDEKPLAHYASDGGKNARFLAGKTLCLPMHPHLTQDDVLFVGEAIEQFFEESP